MHFWKVYSVFTLPLDQWAEMSNLLLSTTKKKSVFCLDHLAKKQTTLKLYINYTYLCILFIYF